MTTQTEGQPLYPDLPDWRWFWELTEPSRFLRSACCGSPIARHFEPDTGLYPVICTGCYGELGAPGREDLEVPA